jgi:tetratricopeptide (TPR) repeat protein
MMSADYRAAVAAEAAGNVDLAAEKYALAGEHDGAVRMHLARAARAGTAQAELAALRDAMRWTNDEPSLVRRASAALGRALWERARAEGIATERDRARVREAAELLVAGNEHATAGEALESIGDHLAAANAYSAGGLVEKMEAALAKDDAVQHRAREEADAFASYETHMRIGRRDDARADLARIVAANPSASAGEVRRLLDQLDTAMLTAGKLELKRRTKPAIVAVSASKIVLGRDALSDLIVRGGGVSRQHAEIDRENGDYLLRDLDSRNGTSIRGLPLSGRVPLAGAGRFQLGDECGVDFEAAGGVLVLRVQGGLDRGLALIAGGDGTRLDLSPVGVPLDLVFQRGRPFVGRGSALRVDLNREPLGDVRFQLVRGDRIVVDGEELDI